MKERKRNTCEAEELSLVNPSQQPPHFPITIGEAKDWFANRPVVSSLTEAEEKIIVPVVPSWEKAVPGYSQSGKEIIVVPLQGDSIITKATDGQANVVMLLSKDSTNVINGQLLMYRADSTYFATHSNNLSLTDFSGEFLIFDLDYNYQFGCIMTNGAPTERIDTVTVTMISKAEVEDRDNNTSTIDCIAYTQISYRCWLVRECCPLNSLDCVMRVETFIDCETTGGGAGGGGGSTSGGGNGGSGGGPSGQIPQTPPQFGEWIVEDVPIKVFLDEDGVLPPGFTPELAEQLKEFCQQNEISQDDYYHLVANPPLTPILLNFCKEYPGDDNSVGNNNQTPVGPNDPQPPLGEGQYCDVLKKIVFDCKLDASQADWLTKNTSLLTPIVNFLRENNYDEVSTNSIKTSIDFLQLPQPISAHSAEYQTFLQNHPECIANENFSDPGLSFIISVWIEGCRIKALNPNMSNGDITLLATATVLKDNLHVLLDIGGLEPTGVGVVCDIANGLLYTYEYDYVNALTSFTAATPVLGWYTTGAKYVTRLVKNAAGNSCRLALKLVDNVVLFAKDGNAARQQLRNMIKPPADHHAHHIVPWEHRGNSVVQEAAKIDGPTPWHMNDAPNGISVHKNYHASESNSFDAHPAYNNAIGAKLTNIKNQFGPNMTPQQAHDELVKLQSAVRKIIETHPTTHVNSISFGPGSWPVTLGDIPNWW